MENILSAKNLSFSYYSRIKALDRVSIDIAKGSRHAVIGSNGSGKSTLLQALDGLIYPSEGELFFRGKSVSEDSLKDAAFLKEFRSSVGYVFQDPDIQLFCPTVFDELLFGPLQLGMDLNEAKGRAEEVMNMLNITSLRERPSYMLSGGEKKRVAIGSVLSINPEALLFDEPTNGLDPRTQCFLVELIFALSEAGKTIVVATHDLALVDELQATVTVLSEDHRVERTGPAEDILGDEQLLLRV
ncbi:MAG: energy-coupling factor ABC transporter ATP-binding protein, partial [Nitrospiraceae bacterium]|nr:energy-coupling factor ABC transporter ATP-binding protein [Nitrospiraceae bacterium]